MIMELGIKIKSLRADRGMTQECLADALHVSPQAVSKWENGVSAPDIGMLPALSVAFGVTIDDLFSLTDTDNLERIKNTLSTQRDLSENTFTTNEAMLYGIINRKPCYGDAYLRLAELYEHRIQTLTRLAVEQAKQAIFIQPEEKAGYSVLTNLLHGYGGDWTFRNTLELVHYEKEVMKKVPDWQEGWNLLLNQLIGNGLLQEARTVIETTAFQYHELAKARLGDIAYAQGNGEEALRLWQACIEEHPDSWRPYAWRADKMVLMGRYEDALRDYASWLEKQPLPRFTDPCICMALLYEELGNIPEAIHMREEQFRICKNEFHFESGEAYDGILREIQRLKTFLP